MLASNESLIELAVKYGYNISHFKDYLSYQMINKPPGVYSIEEYALQDANFDPSNSEEVYYFCLIHGYVGINNLPDYCSYRGYCQSRNIRMYPGKTYKLKKDTI